MPGLIWNIQLHVQCETCAEKVFADGGGRSTEITTPYKFPANESDLDELRMEFLGDLDLKGWDVRDLDHWAAEGKFICPLCCHVEAETVTMARMTG